MLGIPLVANLIMVAVLAAYVAHPMSIGYWVGIGGLVLFGVLPIVVVLSLKYAPLNRVRRRCKRRRIRVMMSDHRKTPPPP